MIFKFECFNNGNKEIWSYDNIRNIVYDNKGIDRFKKYHFNNVCKTENENNFDDNFKLSRILDKLVIILGTKCNFHCDYCFQQKYTLVSDSKEEYVDSFISLLKSCNLKIKEIQLYGGEPLIYWKTLKKLIPKLRELYPKSSFVMPTNGSLLDEDKVVFLTKYKIKINLSYDGKNSNKDFNIFENENVFKSYELIKSMNGEVHLHPTISEKSDNFLELMDFFNKTFDIDEDKIHIKIYNYIKIFDDRRKISEKEENELKYKDKDKIEKNILGYFDYINSIRNYSLGSFNDIVNGWGNDIISGNNIKSKKIYHRCPCSIGKCINVDMLGNVFPCSNNPFVIGGNLSKFDEVYFDCYSDGNIEKCNSCPYVVKCCGNCSVINDYNSKAFDINCHNSKIIYEIVFKKVLERFFGIRFIKFL